MGSVKSEVKNEETKRKVILGDPSDAAYLAPETVNGWFKIPVASSEKRIELRLSNKASKFWGVLAVSYAPEVNDETKFNFMHTTESVVLENVTQSEIYVKFPVDEKFVIDMRHFPDFQ